MITLSFIIMSYYIQTMGKKNGHFSFLCFYFYKCIAYISHLYQMFCSLFSYAFSTFRTQNRKKRERGQAFKHRLDSCARFRSTRRVFREGLFESGKVIFALHDTKWLSYVRIKYLTSAAFIYHMYTYFSIAISMICIFYILYAI